MYIINVHDCTCIYHIQFPWLVSSIKAFRRKKSIIKIFRKLSIKFIITIMYVALSELLDILTPPPPSNEFNKKE